MNLRIFNMLKQNLDEAFSLPKYDTLEKKFDKNTIISELPWTPKRFLKFQEKIQQELDFSEVDLTGTIEQIVKRCNERYMNRFFGEVWQPETGKYQYSGWNLVELINNANPKNVLDFGCGYNPFKGRINNLVGIDPYNTAADYMVDILDFKVDSQSFDHIIVFGSLNFNSKDELEERFAKLDELLMPGGRMYFRANPGHLWPKGPYVDIFPWSFEFAFELAKKHNLELEKFKKDNGDRLYFEFHKPE